jgi:integrase
MTLYGARRGEVLGLRWSDADLERAELTIGRSRVLVGGQVLEKAPKSARGYRMLPLDGELVSSLRTLRRLELEERFAAGAVYSDTGYIAVDELGQPLHPERYSDEFGRLCREAGVPVIRLHDARHTINSLLAAAGVPDHIRAAWCGHTVAVNVSTYTHARPEDLAAAGAVLSRIFAAV